MVLISQSAKEVQVNASHLFAVYPDLLHFGNDLQEGYDGLIRATSRRSSSGWEVRQFFDPVHHPHGYLAVALATAAAILSGLLRGKAHTACTMAVVVIFALLREKF